MCDCVKRRRYVGQLIMKEPLISFKYGQLINDKFKPANIIIKKTVIKAKNI